MCFRRFVNKCLMFHVFFVFFFLKGNKKCLLGVVFYMVKFSTLSSPPFNILDFFYDFRSIIGVIGYQSRIGNSTFTRVHDTTNDSMSSETVMSKPVLHLVTSAAKPTCRNPRLQSVRSMKSISNVRRCRSARVGTVR